MNTGRLRHLRRVVELDFLVINENTVTGKQPNRLTVATTGVQQLDRGQAELLGEMLLEWARRP